MIRWASQHLNIEIGLALRSDRWVSADYWQAAADPSLTLESILERSEVVAVGIDGGGLDDLLGLAVLGRDRDTRQWLLWTHAWAHTSVLERRKSEAGIEGDDRVVGISQGWKLTSAIKGAERRLADGTLFHAGQRLMAWCVGNAKVEPRGNAVMITKQASGTAKIDPLMAAFDAVTLMATNPEPKGGWSIYNDEDARPDGFLVLG